MEGLINVILNRDNLNEAFEKVRKNKGAAGVDAKDGIRVYVPKKSKDRFEAKLIRLTNRNWSIDMETRIQKISYLIQGWENYYKIADIRAYACKIDSQLRRRLRACRWKEWKRTIARYRNLKRLGIDHNDAYKMANTRKGCWRSSNNPIVNRAMPNKYWTKLKLKSLATIINPT